MVSVVGDSDLRTPLTGSRSLKRLRQVRHGTVDVLVPRLPPPQQSTLLQLQEIRTCRLVRNLVTCGVRLVRVDAVGVPANVGEQRELAVVETVGALDQSL